MSGPFFEMTHITGCAREARDHCEYPAWARGSLTVLQCPGSGCHRTNRSQQPPPVSHETLSIHPPAHVTCVNMDTCHRGLEHLVSALWWAFCDLPMMAGLMHPELEPSCGDSECLIAGVTVPYWPHGHWPPRAELRWCQPGLWPSTRATLAGVAWAACDYCGSQSALSCVRITAAATSPMYGLTLGLDGSADPAICVHLII